MWLQPWLARTLLVAGLGLAALVVIGNGYSAGFTLQAVVQSLADLQISNC